MKIILHTLVFLSILSCSGNDITVTGRYIHQLANCNNGGNPEINCTEFMDFIDDQNVDLLMGGGDIVERSQYSIDGDLITIQLTSDIPASISLQMDTDTTLIQIGNQKIWIKDN